MNIFDFLRTPSRKGWSNLLGQSETALVERVERGYASQGGPAAQYQPGGGKSSRLQPANTSPADVLTTPNLADSLSKSNSLVGGRLSQDVEGQFFGTYQVVLPPTDPETDWSTGSLDTNTLSRVPPSQLVKLLIDLSPEANQSVFNYLRFCNPGYSVVAYRKDPESPDPAGQKATQAFIDKLKDLYGSFDVVIGKMFLAAYLRGAFLSELVLDEQAKNPIDFATPDPESIRHVRYNDPVRGWVTTLAQYQLGRLVLLDRPTIRYTPIDPLPGSPYGRPMITPAMFSCLFLLSLLHDLKRVVAQQGYPRLDISIDLEAMRATLPDGAEGNAIAIQAWVDATIADIQRFYAKLQPDDAYVHTNAITLNPNGSGVMDSKTMAGIGELIRFVERMAMRSLKSMPLLMGLAEGGSEANANRQWEIHVAGIKALQHYCETNLEVSLTLALRAQGIPAKVQFRFAELRASEALRDAQTDTLKINNAMQRWLNGWINQDQAAFQGAGVDKADEKEPRYIPNTAQFAGSMVTSAQQSEGPGGEPKADQPNPAPTSNDQGGDKKKKDKATSAKDAKQEKTLPAPIVNPGFQRQLETILGRQNSNGTH